MAMGTTTMKKRPPRYLQLYSGGGAVLLLGISIVSRSDAFFLQQARTVTTVPQRPFCGHLSSSNHKNQPRYASESLVLDLDHDDKCPALVSSPLFQRQSHGPSSPLEVVTLTSNSVTSRNNDKSPKTKTRSRLIQRFLLKISTLLVATIIALSASLGALPPAPAHAVRGGPPVSPPAKEIVQLNKISFWSCGQAKSTSSASSKQQTQTKATCKTKQAAQKKKTKFVPQRKARRNQKQGDKYAVTFWTPEIETARPGPALNKDTAPAIAASRSRTINPNKAGSSKFRLVNIKRQVKSPDKYAVSFWTPEQEQTSDVSRGISMGASKIQSAATKQEQQNREQKHSVRRATKQKTKLSKRSLSSSSSSKQTKPSSTTKRKTQSAAVSKHHRGGDAYSAPVAFAAVTTMKMTFLAPLVVAAVITGADDTAVALRQRITHHWESLLSATDSNNFNATSTSSLQNMQPTDMQRKFSVPWKSVTSSSLVQSVVKTINGKNDKNNDATTNDFDYETAYNMDALFVAAPHASSPSSPPPSSPSLKAAASSDNRNDHNNHHKLESVDERLENFYNRVRDEERQKMMKNVMLRKSTDGDYFREISRASNQAEHQTRERQASFGLRRSNHGDNIHKSNSDIKTPPPPSAFHRNNKNSNSPGSNGRHGNKLSAKLEDVIAFELAGPASSRPPPSSASNEKQIKDNESNGLHFMDIFQAFSPKIASHPASREAQETGNGEVNQPIQRTTAAYPQLTHTRDIPRDISNKGSANNDYEYALKFNLNDVVEKKTESTVIPPPPAPSNSKKQYNGFNVFDLFFPQDSQSTTKQNKAEKTKKIHSKAAPASILSSLQNRNAGTSNFSTHDHSLKFEDAVELTPEASPPFPSSKLNEAIKDSNEGNNVFNIFNFFFPSPFKDSKHTTESSESKAAEILHAIERTDDAPIKQTYYTRQLDNRQIIKEFLARQDIGTKDRDLSAHGYQFQDKYKGMNTLPVLGLQRARHVVSATSSTVQPRS